MNTAEVAEYLRFVRQDGSLDLKGARAWLAKHPHVRQVRRGSSVLVHRDDLDAALTPVHSSRRSA